MLSLGMGAHYPSLSPCRNYKKLFQSHENLRLCGIGDSSGSSKIVMVIMVFPKESSEVDLSLAIRGRGGRWEVEEEENVPPCSRKSRAFVGCQERGHDL